MNVASELVSFLIEMVKNFIICLLDALHSQNGDITAPIGKANEQKRFSLAGLIPDWPKLKRIEVLFHILILLYF